MDTFQLFSLIVVLAALIFTVYKFLTRNNGKMCSDCKAKNMPSQEFDMEHLEIDSDEDSSLDDNTDEEEEEEKDV